MLFTDRLDCARAGADSAAGAVADNCRALLNQIRIVLGSISSAVVEKRHFRLILSPINVLHVNDAPQKGGSSGEPVGGIASAIARRIDRSGNGEGITTDRVGLTDRTDGDHALMSIDPSGVRNCPVGGQIMFNR